MRFASLPYDVARCMGTNCTKKESCARHKQLARDRDRGSNRVVVADALRNGGECEIRIEELDDGKH